MKNPLEAFNGLSKNQKVAVVAGGVAIGGLLYYRSKKAAAASAASDATASNDGGAVDPNATDPNAQYGNDPYSDPYALSGYADPYASAGMGGGIAGGYGSVAPTQLAGATTGLVAPVPSDGPTLAQAQPAQAQATDGMGTDGTPVAATAAGAQVTGGGAPVRNVNVHTNTQASNPRQGLTYKTIHTGGKTIHVYPHAVAGGVGPHKNEIVVSAPHPKAKAHKPKAKPKAKAHH